MTGAVYSRSLSSGGMIERVELAGDVGWFASEEVVVELGLLHVAELGLLHLAELGLLHSRCRCL